jgi:hypothetical protein
MPRRSLMRPKPGKIMDLIGREYRQYTRQRVLINRAIMPLHGNQWIEQQIHNRLSEGVG